MPLRKAKAVIFDLDGTLCNCEHRQHFMQCRPKMREEFHSACINDTVNPAVKKLLDFAVLGDCRIVLLSARPHRFKEQTLRWLEKNNIVYDQLILSLYPSLTDPEFKRKMFKELIEPFYEVLFAVDDRDTVVAMWRELGVTCFDVAGNHFS